MVESRNERETEKPRLGPVVSETASASAALTELFERVGDRYGRDMGLRLAAAARRFDGATALAARNRDTGPLADLWCGRDSRPDHGPGRVVPQIVCSCPPGDEKARRMSLTVTRFLRAGMEHGRVQSMARRAGFRIVITSWALDVTFVDFVPVGAEE